MVKETGPPEGKKDPEDKSGSSFRRRKQVPGPRGQDSRDQRSQRGHAGGTAVLGVHCRWQNVIAEDSSVCALHRKCSQSEIQNSSQMSLSGGRSGLPSRVYRCTRLCVSLGWLPIIPGCTQLCVSLGQLPIIPGCTQFCVSLGQLPAIPGCTRLCTSLGRLPTSQGAPGSV